MRGAIIARSYAGALFELAEREGREAAYADLFDDFVRLLEAEPKLRLFLESPKIGLAEKKAAMHRIFADRLPPLMLNFVSLVLDKGRQRLLPRMAEELRDMVNRKLGRFPVEVTVAREMDERAERDLAATLSSLLERHVVPDVKIDPRILGGIFVKYGDNVLDGTLRRRLMLMRRRMLAAVAPEQR